MSGNIQHADSTPSPINKPDDGIISGPRNGLKEQKRQEEAKADPDGLLMSMEDAKRYLYRNCDSLLRRLAQ